MCQGNVCFAVDQNGNPVADRAPIAQAVGGYFWPRFVITFVAFAVLLTLASMRLVVPAPMRFAFRRRRRDLPPLPEGPMTAGPGSGQGGTLLDETPRLADE